MKYATGWCIGYLFAMVCSCNPNVVPEPLMVDTENPFWRVPKGYRARIKEYRKSCRQGNIGSCDDLGGSLETYGAMLEEPPGRGIYAFRKACAEAGDDRRLKIDSCRTLAIVSLRAHERFEIDPFDILKLLQKVCDLEDAQACLLYGLLYYRETGEISESRRFVEQACTMSLAVCPGGHLSISRHFEEEFFKKELQVILNYRR